MRGRDITEKPQPEVGDAAHTVARALLSIIPGAVELLSAVIEPPLSKRRDEWIESIAHAVKLLEEKVDGFSVESLSQNDTFLTTIIYASHIALRSHQKEKLVALRNAVLNTALPQAPDEDLQLMFLSFIDTFTPWHLRILKFLDDPVKDAKEHDSIFPDWEIDQEFYTLQGRVGDPDTNPKAASMAKALLQVYPALQGRQDFYTLLGKDLYDRALIDIGTISHGATHPQTILTSHTTNMGKLFLAFITSPLKEEL